MTLTTGTLTLGRQIGRTLGLASEIVVHLKDLVAGIGVATLLEATARLVVLLLGDQRLLLLLQLLLLQLERYIRLG